MLSVYKFRGISISVLSCNCTNRRRRTTTNATVEITNAAHTVATAYSITLCLGFNVDAITDWWKPRTRLMGAVSDEDSVYEHTIGNEYVYPMHCDGACGGVHEP